MVREIEGRVKNRERVEKGAEEIVMKGQKKANKGCLNMMPLHVESGYSRMVGPFTKGSCNIRLKYLMQIEMQVFLIPR